MTRYTDEEFFALVLSACFVFETADDWNHGEDDSVSELERSEGWKGWLVEKSFVIMETKQYFKAGDKIDLCNRLSDEIEICLLTDEINSD